MALLAFLLLSAAILFSGYIVVGRALARVFKLSETRDTPAFQQRDGLDFEPARTAYLLPQHFSAIAAAGPIVGPILAGLYFGWGPAWIWIIVGSIFVGGIHDFTALLASVRHRARSIAEVVREYMNPRAYILFLLFIWCALIYVIIAFADVTAGTFVQAAASADAAAPGPAVATSSILYLGLALLMGLVLRYTKLGPGKSKAIMLPLLALAIYGGQFMPADLSRVLPAGANVQQAWAYLLLAYCFVAAMAPVWLLLQPRGELGGYFMYLVIGAGLLGISFGAVTGSLHIEQPFFKGWTSAPEFDSMPLFPILFITVACGACSGCHSVVASGTTSKQLERECDARPVAYGGMLLEGFFACLSLATLMVVATPAAKPDAIYAGGIANFVRQIFSPIVPVHGALVADGIYGSVFQFALLCFATFVFDTLDACTRLARYVLMELLGWKGAALGALATAITLAIPAITLALPRFELAPGKPIPLWLVFWKIFGSSNQLLAALTLLGVTVWLARKRMAWWITFVPTVFMMVMTLWSLLLNIRPYFMLRQGGLPIKPLQHMQFGLTLILLFLALWLIAEAILTGLSMRGAGRSDVGGVEAATA